MRQVTQNKATNIPFDPGVVGLTDLQLVVTLPNGTDLAPVVFTELSARKYVAEVTFAELGTNFLTVTSATATLTRRSAVEVVAYDVADVTAQGVIALDKLNEVDGEVEAVDTKVTAVDAKVVTVDGKVDTVNTNVGVVGTAVAGVDTKVTTVDGKADAIKSKTDNLPADTATKLDTIESKIDGLDTQINDAGYFL